MTDIIEVARQIAAEHVRDKLPHDLRVAAQALRATSWPLDMAEEMMRRSHRLEYAANAIDSRHCETCNRPIGPTDMQYERDGAVWCETHSPEVTTGPPASPCNGLATCKAHPGARVEHWVEFVDYQAVVRPGRKPPIGETK